MDLQPFGTEGNMTGEAWVSAVFGYLCSLAGIGAGQTLAESCVNERVPVVPDACVTIGPEIVNRVVENDRGISEVHRGARFAGHLGNAS